MMMTEDLSTLRARARAQRDLPDPTRAKALRRAAGVSLRELADVVGVTVRTLCYWEAGQRRPSGRQLERYAEALRALASELGAP
jgi:transcriptional regulator with XRE-family HTH domain